MQGCHEGGWATGAACPGPPLAPRPNSVYSKGIGGLLCCSGLTKTSWHPSIYNIYYYVHIII